jgi:excisionase family DNA binding protein
MSCTFPTYQPILVSKEAAWLLRCSVSHIQGLAREGLIPAWRVPNGQWRFSRDKLIEIIARGSESILGIDPNDTDNCYDD